VGIRERLVSYHGTDDFLFADGFDSCIIGVSVGCYSGRVVYDLQKTIESCVERDGMTYQEAVEWIEFNTISAYVGENTPIFIETFNETGEEDG
jgi:hypothetical protein|tara:strand:- start:1876 stop:2154 length:279 start_codon:yes stop_codon:yes gene_type:complete